LWVFYILKIRFYTFNSAPVWNDTHCVQLSKTGYSERIIGLFTLLCVAQ